MLMLKIFFLPSFSVLFLHFNNFMFVKNFICFFSKFLLRYWVPRGMRSLTEGKKLVRGWMMVLNLYLSSLIRQPIVLASWSFWLSLATNRSTPTITSLGPFLFLCFYFCLFLYSSSSTVFSILQSPETMPKEFIYGTSTLNGPRWSHLKWLWKAKH